VACAECGQLQRDAARLLRSLEAVLATGRAPGNVNSWWILEVGAEVPTMFAEAFRRADPAELRAAAKARKSARKIRDTHSANRRAQKAVQPCGWCGHGLAQHVPSGATENDCRVLGCECAYWQAPALVQST